MVLIEHGSLHSYGALCRGDIWSFFSIHNFKAFVFCLQVVANAAWAVYQLMEDTPVSSWEAGKSVKQRHDWSRR